jgi:uncharacterized protein YrrD
MTTRLVKGMPVVSLADGTTLGAIDRVYLDPRQMAVVGFTFHQRSGLFGGASGLVDISDVHAFGVDAVTVDAVAVVRSDLAVEIGHDELIDLDTLLKREVMTENGQMLGRVAAIQFGNASHALVALDLETEGRRKRIDAGEITTVGPDLIIVADHEPAVGHAGHVVRRIPIEASAHVEPERRRRLAVVGA